MPQLKEYQTQEKLFAINERVEEAQNYRTELKNLEVAEAVRVLELRQSHADKQRNRLTAQCEKELQQFEAKMKTQEHSLQIQREKELENLQKQIVLHVNDIKRIQGSIKKMAIDKAETEGELRRVKERSRKTKVVIKQAKNADLGVKTGK